MIRHHRRRIWVELGLIAQLVFLVAWIDQFYYPKKIVSCGYDQDRCKAEFERLETKTLNFTVDTLVKSDLDQLRKELNLCPEWSLSAYILSWQIVVTIALTFRAFFSEPRSSFKFVFVSVLIGLVIVILIVGPFLNPWVTVYMSFLGTFLCPLTLVNFSGFGQQNDDERNADPQKGEI